MSSISMMDFKNITESFLLYSHVKDDPIITLARRIAALLEDASAGLNLREARRLYYEYAALLITEAERYGYFGNLFRRHVCRLFLADENPFTLACERNELNPQSTLYAIALQDTRAFRDITAFDIGIFSRHVGQNENLTDYVPNNVSDNPYMAEIESITNAPALLETFRSYYRLHGCGVPAEYSMLRLDDPGRLIGVRNADATRFDDIIGYAEQKRMLRDNTEAFLKGFPANNVLLIGSRGTGKSSCVKALANEYFEAGLRVVEMPKDRLDELPQVLSMLAERGKSFLLYIDDLSFDESEIQYKHLKSVLEGGVVRRPKNVLFYATSNRRHIVQEKWSDKAANYEDEELHSTDTRNEKMSLSDRFGLTITFPKPSPQEYFEIVAALAKRDNLDVSEDFLREQSAAWELNQKGLSGRTARQFLDHMICEINRG